MRLIIYYKAQPVYAWMWSESGKMRHILYINLVNTEHMRFTGRESLP